MILYHMLMSVFFGKVYTKCGRRAMPTMMMGSAATFIVFDECRKLLLVTRKGLLHVWDLYNQKCVLHDSWYLWLPWTQTLLQKMQVSLNPDFFYDHGFIIYNNHLRAHVLSIWVLEFFFSFLTTVPSNWMTFCLFIYSLSPGTIKVISTKLSRPGSPLVVQATRHSFLFWCESHVLAKGCRWLLPCFKLCELLEFKLSCDCHYLISLYFIFLFLLIGGYFELFLVESEVCNEVFKKLILWMQPSFKHNAAVSLL